MAGRIRSETVLYMALMVLVSGLAYFLGRIQVPAEIVRVDSDHLRSISHRDSGLETYLTLLFVLDRNGATELRKDLIYRAKIDSDALKSERSTFNSQEKIILQSWEFSFVNCARRIELAEGLALGRIEELLTPPPIH